MTFAIAKSEKSDYYIESNREKFYIDIAILHKLTIWWCTKNNSAFTLNQYYFCRL